MTTELIDGKIWYLLDAGWVCTSVWHLPCPLSKSDRWLWWSREVGDATIPMDAAILLQQAEDKKEVLP